MSERPRWLTETARTPAADEPRSPSGSPARAAGPARGARTGGSGGSHTSQSSQGARGSQATRGAGKARGSSSSTRRTDRPSRPRAAAPAQGGARARRAGIATSRARFERRASAVRRRPWLVVGVGAGTLAVLAAVVWALWFSPLFATRSVTVTGLSDPAEQQRVVEAAAVPAGTPLVRVDTGGAADRVRRISTVAGATVSRSWPSTVVVSVQRKAPVLAVKNPQGQLQVVDDTGVPFDTVTSLPPGVAEVNAASEAPDPAGIRAAISILQLLPSAQRAQVSGVTVTSADLVTLQVGDVSVVWGGLGDGPKKLTVLQALLPTHPAVIDVSAPDTPVTR